MKRSIIISAALLTATLTFGQHTETVTSLETVEAINLGNLKHPQLKVNVPVEESVLIPVLEQNIDDGETPTIQLSLPEGVTPNRLEMEVYPNPSKGLFKIRMTQTEQQIKAIEVFDLTGKIRYSDTQLNFDVSGDKDLDISVLENGVYILRMVLAEDVLVERIVKRD